MCRSSTRTRTFCWCWICGVLGWKLNHWLTYRISQRGNVGGGSTAYTYTLTKHNMYQKDLRFRQAIGTTIPQGVRGTTNVSPTNPSLNGCSNLTNTISDKESEMSNTISENTPKIKINYYHGECCRVLLLSMIRDKKQ